MDEDKEPWWNDADKVGGMMATLTMLAVGILLVGIAVKLVTLMF